MTKSTLLFVLLLSLSSLVGCGGDGASIEALEALNDRLVAAGGEKAVRMNKVGDSVGTIYILSDVEEVMPHVASMKSVKEIYLQSADFTDKHVAMISGISELNSLVVSKTKITDDGVKSMEGMQLEALFLDGTGVTSACLPSVATLSGLTSLDLGGTNVQDDLTPLAKMASLQWLVLRDMDLSNISDASLEALCAMPDLRRLTVTNSNLTLESQTRLKSAKPGLNLEVGGGGGGESIEPTAAGE